LFYLSQIMDLEYEQYNMNRTELKSHF